MSLEVEFPTPFWTDRSRARWDVQPGVPFYNGRGAAERWIKEIRYAINRTRLSRHKFEANQVRIGG